MVVHKFDVKKQYVIRKYKNINIYTKRQNSKMHLPHNITGLLTINKALLVRS